MQALVLFQLSYVPLSPAGFPFLPVLLIELHAFPPLVIADLVTGLIAGVQGLALLQADLVNVRAPDFPVLRLLRSGNGGTGEQQTQNDDHHFHASPQRDAEELNSASRLWRPA
jgi:hypothetical protein